MAYGSDVGAEETGAYDPDAPLSQQDGAAVAAAAHDCIAKAERSRQDWADEARLNNNMVAGHQWAAEDADLLREQERPIIVFNRLGALMDAVCGAQVNNRQETRFLPRTVDDGGGAEMWQGALDYVSDLCDAEDEVSEAFRDCAITGMGWTINYLDYTDDPQGKLIKERVDPLEMWWDQSAEKKNLADAKWYARVLRVPRDEIKARWADYSTFEAPGGRRGPGTAHSNSSTRSDYGDGDADEVNDDLDTDEIVEYQWCETYTVYIVGNPESGELEQLDAETWVTLGERMGREERDQLRHVKQMKKRWYRAFICGDDTLERGECPDPEAATFGCLTGKRDREKRMWYGIVRPLVDPQRWANSWLSNAQHIIASSAKGGVIAEEGSVTDTRKFEENYAKAGSVSWVAPGALARGAVKEKAVPNFPAGFDRLLQFAIGSIPEVSGINKEMMGTVDREQAGVLEAQRKQAGQAVIAPLFDALRLYYKRDGRQMMRLISTYMPPDKVFRITGPHTKPEVIQRAMLPDYQQFDVVVDQAPTSPNQKIEVWGFLQPVLPALLKLGLPPPVMAELLRYSPLPESAVEEIITGWQEHAQQQGPPPEQQKMEAELQMKQAELQMKREEMEMKLALKQQEAEMDMQIERSKFEMQMHHEHQRFQQKAQFDREMAATNVDIKQGDAAAKRANGAREAERPPIGFNVNLTRETEDAIGKAQAEAMQEITRSAQQLAQAAQEIAARRRVNGAKPAQA